MDSSFFLTTVAAAAIGLFILTTVVAAAIGLFTLLRKLRLHQDDNREKDSSSSSPSSSLSPSPVPPPSSPRIWTHHVFPSFRGEDVRKDFLSHIQMEFERKGITPFIDNEIKRGDDIGPELIRAIRGSKIAIILLSKNYASSKWCLDELVEIMKCREELGQTVMAIFYKVDPSDVKKLAGDFGRVFKKTCAGRTKENIERWRQALAKVATVAGYHSSTWGYWDNEAAMIKKIATDISDMLNNFTPSNDFDGLVGMGAHLEKMEPLLCLGSDEVRMIGIWGPPGIGKTTIARVAYSKLSNNFQLSVFMDDLKANYTRLCSDDYSLKLQLQQQFMSQITNQKDMVVSHLGVASNRLKDKKVLVVLDGVDQSVQLEAMAKETWWFGPGSRIIITAQDQKLFRAHGVNLIYKVDFPTKDEALQIFCTYSFGQKYLAEKSLISIDRGVIRMHSLLEKLGREIVCKQSIHEPRLRQFLWEETEIFEVLTGDTTGGSKSVIGIKLEYSTEGEKIEISEKAFEGMSNLQFLKVSGYSHPLQLTRGLNYISHKLRFLEWTQFPMTCLPSILNLEFLVELIMHTSKLEKLWEGTKPLPCLKWMNLRYSENLKELPDLSTATNLELDLRNCSSLIKLPSLNGNSLEKLYIGGCSSLVEFPSFIENAVSLRKLDLRSYPNILELPSYVGNATNLEKLDLSNCLDLVELPLSLGNLQKLKKLVLTGCSKLEVFPTNINLESLERLDLAGCSSLDLGGCSTIGNVPSLRMLNLRSLPQLLDLPSFIGNAINLYLLDLSGCSNLVELPVFIGNLQKLSVLELQGCSKLEFLPTNINLESLRRLNLRDCSMLKCFPQISTNIRHLDLTGTAIEQVPPSIRSWPRLKELKMSYFENLKEFPHALERITELCLTDTDIQELPPWVKQISCLNSFVLKGCRKLVSIPPISDSIRFLDASDCESLEILECSFHNKIITLNFANCFKLNQEARDLIIQNSREAVLPGGQVPAYFTHRATGGGPLSIKLNEKALPIYLRFKACILLVDKGDHDACSKEKSTEVSAMYKNRHHRLYPALAQHLYTFEVEKEVTSSELLFEFKLESDDVWKIGECGIVQHLEVP
uniref:ADP-ribosyl cyclase/cyclic ADP-ribose hydrolase n=1 Tax=Brassica napus TaxID=3708 RepID=A0A7S8ZX85_BRANA|nr:putative disease resistance protein TAO1 [Brassica napus]